MTAGGHRAYASATTAVLGTRHLEADSKSGQHDHLKGQVSALVRAQVSVPSACPKSRKCGAGALRGAVGESFALLTRFRPVVAERSVLPLDEESRTI
ncbi:hypothetical protein SSP24_67030 [Streptomyces spinoverrucosus]|uniref:Uncharacterized protein n=1 Tax=Streptomyces spinoverrucosus TaxID=284043 RepID=A0A4Y3VS51_9ACTN|nr:hypothetical protein SSP24_67030 [Streptomyces spinoverrucosus]GHB93572.1 hypothetical protein GCM10010397_77930 [Streptomyces spinoverrucosus]